MPRAPPRCPHQGRWQGQRGSNPRPAVLETAALPTELYPFMPILQRPGQGPQIAAEMHGAPFKTAAADWQARFSIFKALMRIENVRLSSAWPESLQTLTYFRQSCSSLNPSTSRILRFESSPSYSAISRVKGTFGKNRFASSLDGVLAETVSLAALKTW